MRDERTVVRVRTLQHLGQLNLKLKRDDSVQITRCGSHYKARFKGRANAVFGATAEEAIERLRDTPSKLVKDSARNARFAERNWLHGFRAMKG